MAGSSYKRKKIIFRVLFYFLLYSAMFIILMPFMVMVLSSLMSEHEIYLNNYPNFHIFPNEWNTLDELFANYSWLATKSERGIATFVNSLQVAIPTTIISTVVASIAAYPLSRSNLKGKNTILFIFLFATMVPTMAILIPLYLQFTKMGLYDNIWGVVVVLTAYILPFSIWVMKGFFDTVPDSLEEAALIDGCTRWKALIKIIIPLALPGIGAVAVYAFISAWAEFLIPLVLTRMNAQVFTMYIGLFVNAENVERSKVIAAGVVSCIPVVILALGFQKLIVRGLIEGAVKG
jgi:multiple sugar transport system permease protein